MLPLCNNCWRILERGCFPELPAGTAPEEFDRHIEAVLGCKLCPVCNGEHTWRDHADTYTDGFYGTPQRYREICFDCLDGAINRGPKDRSIVPQRAGLLRISQLIDALPRRNMNAVVFEQCQNLEVAVQVVETMQRMWTFDRLASRHKKSWFAALVKSGCLVLSHR